jgi:hypothetical protein
VILLILEDKLASIASGCEVVETAPVFYAEEATHGINLS